MAEEYKATDNQENLPDSNHSTDQEDQKVKAEKVISSEEVEQLETAEIPPNEYKRYNLEDELKKLEKLDVEGILDYFENDILANLSQRSNAGLIAKIVRELKDYFEKKYQEYIAEKKQQFVDEGGRAEDFKPEPDDSYYKEKFDALVNKFNEELKEYYRRRAEYQKNNLVRKLEIIEQIKELSQSAENPGTVYRKFKELESEWRKIGSVPSNKYKDLMESYNIAVEMVYDYLEISRELMEIDRQKNYEEKVKIIKIAESLPYETLPIKSFNELQDLHKKWKEIGPVPKDKKDELWEKFRTISKKINEAYSSFFKEKRRKENENLKKKSELVKEAEKIANGEYTKPREWKAQKDKLLELDQIWRTIGRVPKKYNDSIYEQFRAAFDKFFDKKRAFFENYDEILKQNLEKKLKLIERVEAIKDSTDWKKTTHEIIKIQNEWKEIGPVPQEESDKIWQKFREVCNYFFDRRAEYYDSLKAKEKENLDLKKALIEEMKSFEPSGNMEADISKIDEFTSKWNEIGFVPIENKDEINKAYSEALKELYEKAQIDEDKKALFFYEEKVRERQNSKGFDHFLQNEMTAINKRIRELEKQIIKYENNLAFFSDSDNEFLQQIRDKIEAKKSKIDFLTKKLNILRRFLQK